MPTDYTWNGESISTWVSQASVFAEHFPVYHDLISGALVQLNAELAAAQNCDGFVERVGFPIFDEQIAPDVIKSTRRLYLVLDAPVGTILIVKLGAQMDAPTDTVDYGPDEYWIVGTTRYIDKILTGRYFSIRIESIEEQAPWTLLEYAIDWDVVAGQ